eukprot:gene48679-22538_t
MAPVRAAVRAAGGAVGRVRGAAAAKVRDAINAFGGAFVASLAAFTAVRFDARLRVFGDRAALEGPSFAMARRLAAVKARPHSAFFTVHLSWPDRAARGMGCPPGADDAAGRTAAERWCARGGG